MTGWLPRRLRFAALFCVGLGAVALYLLSTATANTAVFAHYYPALLAVNGALVLTLAGLVVYQLVLLGRRLRQRAFGSRLALRFVLMFALMALIPGALMYAISVHFLARSIESWFEVRVDKALEGGLALATSALDTAQKDLVRKAETMADALATQPPSEQAALLNALREGADVQQAMLLTERGRMLAVSGTERAALVPETPAPSVLRQARAQGRYGAIESLTERGLHVRAMVVVGSTSLGEETRLLQLLHPVSARLAAEAETVQAGTREYQELLLARRGLKRLYGVTLTLALLVALLSAFLLAFLLSERLASPLATLAEGTRSVAQGDFSQQIPVSSRDELGVLTQSFNTMTGQLAQARAASRSHEAAMAAAKAYLESLLASLSAGVMSFDRDFRLRSANPSADAILELAAGQLVGERLATLAGREARIGPIAQAILSGFAEEAAGWERQVALAEAGREKALLIRGTRFAAGADEGYVVVFDDISHVIQAQRQAAWSEVARRLAHEIKNPLTPIQLSAERVQLKLSARLAPADAEMLARSTRTIVEQVAALKSMVDAFSQYARSPEPRAQPLDLNQLTREVLGLYETMGPHLELAADLPLVRGDARLLRQVIHNLVQNAQDALAEVERPRIVVATADTGRAVRLVIEDNGSGFPENLLQRAFEPYVTTKQKGTGLGLSIVKKIVEDHGGSVTLENVKPRGARVVIELPRETGAATRMSA